MFLNDEDKEIEQELLNNYPDRDINGIHKNKELHNRVNRRWNKLKISKREYMNLLGFTYSRKNWGEKITEDNINIYLEELYKDKVIPNLTDIMKEDQKLYMYINEYCFKNKINNITYLNEKGYSVSNIYRQYEVGGEIVKGDFNISGSMLHNPLAQRNKYNIEALCKLADFYDVNMSEIAKILKVSRQLIDQQVKRNKVVSSFSDEEEDFEDEVIEIIISLIENYEFEYDRDEIIIRFYWGNKIGDIAIVYKYGGYVKCVFNQDGIVKDMLEEYWYYRLGKKDIFLLKKIKECKNIINYKRWTGDETKIRIDDDEIIKLVNKNRRVYNMSIEKYFDLLGLNLYTTYDELEDRLYKSMKLNIDEDGIVKIPPKDYRGKQNPVYVKISRDINKLGKKGIEEMSEYFGLNYQRKVNRNSEEKNKKLIFKRYLIENDKIYIDSQDPFYNTIVARAMKNNMSLNQYISNLGFIKITKKDLPIGYIQYDWRKDLSSNNDSKILIDKAMRLLESIGDNNKEIYIKSDSYEYNTLWKYAYALDITINQLINKCGFIRVYKEDKSKGILEKDKKYFSIEDIESRRRQEIFNNLKSLENKFEEKTINNKVIKRNSTLPRLLKSLYMYKCQLCEEGENVIPSIEMNNGEEYVEVHHITQLSDGRIIEDEGNNELDSYKNCIVVCCFHHKFLHYHHGGFKKIKIIDDKLYFESEKGETIPIVTNYHLKKID